MNTNSNQDSHDIFKKFSNNYFPNVNQKLLFSTEVEQQAIIKGLEDPGSPEVQEKKGFISELYHSFTTKK